MLDEQPVTLVPVSGSVQVQRLLVAVSVAASSCGFGLVDPLLRDQQPLGQETFPPHRLVRLLQGAVESQQLPHRTLPLTGTTEEEIFTFAGDTAASDESTYRKEASLTFSSTFEKLKETIAEETETL